MLRIFDAHVHLFDCKANTYAFLEHEDRSFKAIAGDYSALPRRYLTDDYRGALLTALTAGCFWSGSADNATPAFHHDHCGRSSGSPSRRQPAIRGESDDGARPSDHARRAALVAGQEPFAIVLGCSDSRVPRNWSSTRASATSSSFESPATSSHRPR